MVQRPRPDLRAGCAAIRTPTATAGGPQQWGFLPRSPPRLRFEPVDHKFGGEGRFIVLTATGNLCIFDLTMETGRELVGSLIGVVDVECPGGVGCPSLVLTPGFAYVTDPANNVLYEVYLEEAEIEREFQLNAPAQLVVLGWFEYEEELVFHE